MENKSIIENSIKQDLAGTDFVFFDRVEGHLYPGEVSSIKRECNKETDIILCVFGYEDAYMNQVRNLGEFIQSSGKLMLETFKIAKTQSGGAMDINFQFMAQDSKTYTFNEMRIWWSYMLHSDGRKVEGLSPTLKLTNGIKNATRVYLSKYGIKYHFNITEELYDTLYNDLIKNPNMNDGFDLVLEIYIK